MIWLFYQNMILILIMKNRIGLAWKSIWVRARLP